MNENDIKAYVKRFWKGTKWASFMLHKDHVSNLIIFLMYYFLYEKDEDAFQYVSYYYMIRTYTNLMNRQIKYCNIDVFRYTLDHLNKTHLFSREKTIPNSIMFLTNQLIKRYQKGIFEQDKNKIGM